MGLYMFKNVYFDLKNINFEPVYLMNILLKNAN